MSTDATRKRRWMRRRSWTGPGAPGLVAAIYCVLACIAVALFLLFTTMMPFAAGEQLRGDTVVVSYSGPAFVMVLLAGGGMILAALKWGFHRQLINWLLLASGVAFIGLGLPYLAMEKVVIGKNFCTVRKWFGLSETTVRFAEIRDLKYVEEPRRMGLFGLPRSRRASKITYTDSEGRERILLGGRLRSALYSSAYPQIMLAWALHHKGLEYPVRQGP